MHSTAIHSSLSGATQSCLWSSQWLGRTSPGFRSMSNSWQLTLSSATRHQSSLSSSLCTICRSASTRWQFCSPPTSSSRTPIGWLMWRRATWLAGRASPWSHSTYSTTWCSWPASPSPMQCGPSAQTVGLVWLIFGMFDHSALAVDGYNSGLAAHKQGGTYIKM